MKILERPRILAITPEPRSRAEATRLAPAPCELVFVPDARAALARLEECHFDVLLCMGDAMSRGEALRLVAEAARRWPVMRGVLLAEVAPGLMRSAAPAHCRQPARIPRRGSSLHPLHVARVVAS